MSEDTSNNADRRSVVIERIIPAEVPRPTSSAVMMFTTLLLLLIILIAVIGLLTHWSVVVAASALVMLVLIVATVLAIPAGIAGSFYHQFRKSHLHLEHTRVDLEMKQEQLATVQDERARANELHAVQLQLMQTRLAADERGNRPFLVNPYTQQVTEVASGNYMQPVPAHYHFDYRPELTPGAATSALPAASDMRIPSFAESIASGDISPRQRDMLFSYELVEDEMTGQLQGLSPIRGEIGSQHTQFIVAGSQSGKTTYMSGIVAQAVAMRTVLYIIDPHKKHPEKSLAARLAAFQPWMILPPASTHEEIRRLLDHATRIRDTLIGGETLYEGYHVMFLVDEVPALMASQRSQEKLIRQLYTDLAVFMQSIGTQTAKFGMTGLFASQFATKDALGEIDFRDSCMSQFIMRLHPIQAQAMRILGKDRVNAIPKFPKGHGFLLLSDSTSEPLRVAAGNVTMQDLTVFAGQLPPSPLPFATRPRAETTTKQPGQSGHFSAESARFNAPETLSETSMKQPDETAIEASYTNFCALKRADYNQGQIIWKLWGVQAGATNAYRDARNQYVAWDERYRREQEESEVWRTG